MDTITLSRINLLHPEIRKEAFKIYEEICKALTNKKVICRFAHTLRTFNEQNALYAQGRTIPGKIVTDAKAGQSWHNYGLAIDIVLLIDKDGNGTHETASWDINTDFDNDKIVEWKEITDIFLKYGWEFLKDKKGKRYDHPHFQKTFGLTIKDAQRIYKEGKFVEDKQYIWLN